ncbi:flagellar assembly peptidoglycan hydrolase FlgJ [Pseudomonas monteilii]|uniref:flagellar assembly peptidoglycan hydrolase FlgJ n=1 Tax=Pseudomonas monteilii TaxID=76759 RepID=UPI0018AAAD88|nr:flagellar assembly peptidoglycan hydrolase FlgJ [Pseudomonas monteilii]MBF8745417.1 flagellar assembly peptidoglycan hydrolase FlgJ [Pseudomonas monteilii]
MKTVDTGAYTDLNRLNALKVGDKDSEANLRKVAQEFESLFVSEMLKSMRAANNVLAKDNPLNTETTKQYQEMYDQQLAVSLSREGGGIGLQDVLMRQLSKTASSQRPGGNPFNRDAGTSGALGAVHNAAADHQVASATHNDVAALNQRRLSLPSKLTDRLLAGIVPGASPAAPANTLRRGADHAATAVGAAGEYGDWTQSPTYAGLLAGGQRSVVQVPLAPGKSAFANADEFVATMLPIAQEAAQRIGVEPKVLVAQAALETGWGRSILRQSDGSSSHNLFNIKATGSWKGEQARALTSEFRDGQMVKESAAFRAYDSYADSFHDLANLLLNNDRYQEVVKSADNPEQFAAELQEAGYATDPNYARKISAIVRQLDKYQTYAANGTQTTL